MGKLINIDNGGTLTDIWVLDGAVSYHTKTLTTPYDLSRCLFEGLKKVAGDIYGSEDIEALLQSTDHIRYSTTQGTNALVEKKGPRLGLVIDEALRVSDFFTSDRAQSLFETLIGDRVETLDDHLDEDAYTKSLINTVNRLSSEGANRIVVCFAGEDYLQQEAHFRRVSLRLFPRHLLGAVPTLYAGNLSSDPVAVRRGWSAIVNAFLHPAMERFLYNAENKLRDYRVRNPLLIYRNDGFSGRVAKTIALKTYSSGPRGGMESAKTYADYYGFERCVTMDVGGTTTDLGLVENGIIRSRDRGDVEGIECSLPLCDIVSIGIGGGSIFRVVQGELSVGPDSVGGAPGPACFAMGGKEATITDAFLVMGLLDPKTYFGGDLPLDPERARSAILTQVATPLGVSVEKAAYVMRDTWARKLAASLSHHTELTDRTVLLAFGGGGPMGVLAVAEAAGIDKVLVPRLSAVFSAQGIGFSDIAHSADAKLENPTDEALRSTLETLTRKVRRDMFSEGFELSECTLQAQLLIDGALLPLDLEKPTLPPGLSATRDVTAKLTAIKAVKPSTLPAQRTVEAHEARLGDRRTLSNPDGTPQPIPVIKLEDQQPGARGQGPAIIEEAFWTCKVQPGWTFEFTVNGDVLFTRNA